MRTSARLSGAVNRHAAAEPSACSTCMRAYPRSSRSECAGFTGHDLYQDRRSCGAALLRTAASRIGVCIIEVYAQPLQLRRYERSSAVSGLAAASAAARERRALASVLAVQVHRRRCPRGSQGIETRSYA